MKIPKLKYYYYALNATDYEEFAQSRTVVPNSRTTLNPRDGTVSTTPPWLYFYARPTVADTRYRQLNKYSKSVYVLRIPAELVDRSRLTAAPDPEGMWIYDQSIPLPHCGVELFEMPADFQEVEFEVVARSAPKSGMISIPIT